MYHCCSPPLPLQAPAQSGPSLPALHGVRFQRTRGSGDRGTPQHRPWPPRPCGSFCTSGMESPRTMQRPLGPSISLFALAARSHPLSARGGVAGPRRSVRRNPAHFGRRAPCKSSAVAIPSPGQYRCAASIHLERRVDSLRAPAPRAHVFTPVPPSARCLDVDFIGNQLSSKCP